jgi:hypothetical protein
MSPRRYSQMCIRVSVLPRHAFEKLPSDVPRDAIYCVRRSGRKPHMTAGITLVRTHLEQGQVLQ